MTSTATSTTVTTEALPGPRGLDKLHRVRQLFRDPSTALDGLHHTCGPISELRLGPTRIAVIGDPGLLHQVFSMPADQVRTLIGAGYDTTASALAGMLWCAAAVARHVRVTDQLATCAAWRWHESAVRRSPWWTAAT